MAAQWGGSVHQTLYKHIYTANALNVRNEFQLRGSRRAQHVAHARIVKDIFLGCDFCVTPCFTHGVALINVAH